MITLFKVFFGALFGLLEASEKNESLIYKTTVNDTSKRVLQEPKLGEDFTEPFRNCWDASCMQNDRLQINGGEEGGCTTHLIIIVII